MSWTALAWVLCYMVLAILSLRRASWAIGLYLLTFYLSPNCWWWGAPLRSVSTRINLFTAMILACVVFFCHRRGDVLSAENRRMFFVLLFYAANATAVHVLFAANPERSLEGMLMVWKQVGLLWLMVVAIRDRFDFRLFIGAILIGSLYIGYAVVIDHRGHVVAGRLEGVVVPGANDSNYLAGLMALCLPLGGNWLLLGNRWQKVLAIPSLVLSCEVILRCNSRGAFLAILAGGAWLLASSTGRARRYAVAGVLLALLAAWCMIGDPRIGQRFETTFAKEEQRDDSAQSRLLFWQAAVHMIGDYPLGSGSEAAFKSDRGYRYVQKLDFGIRAVHNGYLDIAAGWGIQGLTTLMIAIGLIWWRVRRIRRRAGTRNDVQGTLMGACWESALVTQLVSSFFVSSLDGEWFYWLFALGVGYEKMVCEHALPQTSRGACPDDASASSLHQSSSCGLANASAR